MLNEERAHGQFLDELGTEDIIDWSDDLIRSDRKDVVILHQIVLPISVTYKWYYIINILLYINILYNNIKRSRAI